MAIKFDRKKVDGLSGLTEVWFTEVGSENDPEPFRVIADRGGIRLRGSSPYLGQEDLDDFARTVSLAWREHKKLLPKIATTVAGH